MFIKRIKNRFLTLILLIISPVFIYGQNDVLFKKYSPEALKQDAQLLKEIVFKMHPGIGLYKPISFYENLFNDFITNIRDSLSEKEFRIKLKLLFDELHCGHSDILLSKAYSKALDKKQFNYLPYYFIALNNKLFTAIPVNKKRDSLLKPTSEILKINNISSDSICTYIKHFYTSDGYINSGKDLFLSTGFNYYYPSLFGRPDSFLVEYKSENEIKSEKIKAVKLTGLPALPVYPKEDSTWIKYKRANISYGFINKNKTAMIIKIKSFKHSRYKKVYRKIFKLARKNNVQHLVIDLRNNGGGSLMNSYRLASYCIDKPASISFKTRIKNYPYKKYTKGNLSLKITHLAFSMIAEKNKCGDTICYKQKIKPRKKNHYNQNIYVLINGHSFSASCLTATYLQSCKKAVLIGSETSGTKEGCNAVITPYYTLPNTKVRARIPAFRIIHDINPALSGRGVLPDYEIKYEVEDILKRKDLEMDFIKKLIDENRK